MKSGIKPTKASYPSEGKPERNEESFLPKTQINKSVESAVHLNCLFWEPKASVKEHCNFEFIHQWAWGTDRAGCQMQRTLSRIYQLIANWMEKNITWDGRQLNRAINLGFASSRLHGCNERGSKIFVLERKGAIRIDHNSSVAEGVTNLIVQAWFYGRLNLF